jgi:glycosyltransferase involved in cell wall biosynthesis
MKKKIVIINQDSGYLMIDIANALSQAGYQIYLITGRLVRRNIALAKSIEIDKIVKYKRSNTILRLVTWFTALFQIILKIWFKYSDTYLLIVSNPPFAPLIPLFCKNRYSLLIYDIYIELPEELPFLNSRSFIVKLWKKAHSKVFAKADKVYTLTEGMQNVIRKYCKGENCEVVPLWSDNDFLKPITPSGNPFIIQNNLQDKFVVLYSGNIGAHSGVENMIEVASLVKSDQIIFVIIGEGSKKRAIIDRIKELGLRNCILLPWLDTQMFPYSIASASLAVVTVMGQYSKYAIPSKLFNYMSVGAPVLCLADPSSDLGKLVITNKIGKCFDAGMKDKAASFIMQVYDNPDEAKVLSRNSLNTSKNYTRDNISRFLIGIRETY